MNTIGLVWIYCGSDVDRRMSTVDGMFAGTRVSVRRVSGAIGDGVRRRLSSDPTRSAPARSGPSRIVEPESTGLRSVVSTFPDDTRVVVFWHDDDKAVGHRAHGRTSRQ